PGDFAADTIREVVYGDSDLELPTLGTPATIEHMSRDDVHAFYRRWYVPNNMILTLAGNFDREQALDWLAKHYGGVAPGTLERPLPRPPQPIEVTRGVTRRGGDARALALVFAAPTWGDEDQAAFAVAGELLTLDGDGLLTRALAGLDAEQRPDVSTWWETAPGYGRLVVRFDLPPGADPEALLPLLQRALADALDAGIDEAAIRGIARLTATQTLLNREQLRMTGIYIAADLVHGGPDGFVGYLGRLEAVTADDVARALGRWLAGAPCLAVLIEPGEASPAAAARQPAMGGGGHGQPGAMPGAMPGANAAAPPAAPPAAAPPKVAPAPAPERTVLPSGAVVVSATNPDSPLTAVHVTVRARARLDRELAAAGAVDLVHRLLNEGFPGCDGPCLAARLRELGALIKTVDDPSIPMDDYYTDGRFSFIRVECAAEHGRAVLALLAEALRGAAFDKADFARVRDRRLAELGRQQGSARAAAGGLLAQAVHGDHPLALPPEGDAASLGSLTYEQVRAVHAAAFSPGNLIVACVGPQTHAQWCDDVARLLPGAGRPTPDLPPLPVTAAPAATTATLGGQLCAIRLGSVLDVETGDEPALGLLVAILSDRLAMDLRETRGLSYSAGAAAEIEAGQAVLTAWLNPPAPRRDEGLAALREFVAGFDAATITADEVARTHAARRGRLMMRRLSSLGQAYYLAMAELDGGVATAAAGAPAGAAPTVEQLQAAAAKYLTGRPWIEVVVD
ncbi:insulinase family protein, partial [bacterium]|nr:insulinase family protein [bacterium]